MPESEKECGIEEVKTRPTNNPEGKQSIVKMKKDLHSTKKHPIFVTLFYDACLKSSIVQKGG
jgi:hypothetical protein